MPYILLLTDEAIADLAKLAPCCRKAVGARLRQVAQSPSQFSVTASFAYVPKGRISHTECDHPEEDRLHKFAIQFQFSQDETQIVVLLVGHTIHDRLI